MGHTRLAELENTDRYRTNYFLHWYPPEEEIAVDPPKEEPPAKLPWDGDEYTRTQTSAKEGVSAHPYRNVKPTPQPQMTPHAVYRYPGKTSLLDFNTVFTATSRRLAPAV